MAEYRVLVVDDNHEIRRMVTASIKTLGTQLDVLDVPSAEEALLISASVPLDLMVLDFRLPGMTGLELVSRLRQRKPELKIILVTGVEEEATRRQIAEAGVAAYFFKPIEITKFLEAVKRCLGLDQVAASVPAPAALEPLPAPAPKTPAAVPVRSFQPNLNQRLTALQKQIRAAAVVFLNEMGQVLDEAGSGKELTGKSSLLPSLMDAFRASQRVSDALAKDSTESLLCYTYERQRVYFALVGPSHALLVAATGFFEPDKLGMIDRAIHLAVLDLKTIVESAPETQAVKKAEPEAEQAALPPEVTIDQKTMTDVANMFTKLRQGTSKEDAEQFWEALGENGALDGTNAENVLSYEEARKMGLAMDEDAKP